MIGRGRFSAQLSAVKDILTKAGLLEEQVLSPNKDLGASHFRGMSYRDVYKECLREYAYDFRLTDQSLLLFRKGGTDEHDGSLSFSYYECPAQLMSYGDFVGAEYGVTSQGDNYDDEIAAWGDDLRAEYEQYIASAEWKSIVTPVRYDYRASDYREGIHPASHVHFGFSSEIRVATRRVLNPISFALLVARQCYPNHWQRLLNVSNSPTWLRNVRSEIKLVHDRYWRGGDEAELALH